MKKEYTIEEYNLFDRFVGEVFTNLYPMIGEKKTVVLSGFNPDSTIDMLFLNIAYLAGSINGVKIQLSMSKWKYFWLNRRSSIEFSRYTPSAADITDETTCLILPVDREEILKNACVKCKTSFATCGDVYEAYYKK